MTTRRCARLGIAHHLGRAVAVVADEDHRVLDRRRLELLESGVASAPVEHELAGLVATVRAPAAAQAAGAIPPLIVWDVERANRRA